MTERLRLQYVEVDVTYCTHSFGVAPCVAAIGVTGPAKCFNTLATCQDRPHFGDGTVTLRFAVDTGFNPRNIDAIPNIEAIDFTPGRVSLGESLGTRSSLSVTFRDSPHPDTGAGFDKYRAERPYNAWEQGTLWGKFRARQPYLQGRALRWIQGFVGDELADMETRHFFIDSFDGPGLDGRYSITAKDILKFLDDDRAQAPLPSPGELAENIDGSAVSAALFPAGTGAANYPASGYLAIGGAEVVSFTRSGDILTVVRGRLGTEQVGHEQRDRMQVVLRYFQMDVADIIRDLMVTYAGVDPAYIPLADWQAETEAYVDRLYSANIAEPTSVKALITELIQQVGLAIWWDDIGRKIRLQAIRPVETDEPVLSACDYDQGSLTVKEQPEKRISSLLVYFAILDPLRKIGDAESYRSAAYPFSDQAISDHGSAAFKTVYSRWIPQLATNTAFRVGAIQIGRYRDPPRRFGFSVFRGEGVDIAVGDRFNLEAYFAQDADGAPARVPVQITRLDPAPDRFKAEAEEMKFADLDLVDIGDPDPPPPPESPVERLITISGSKYNLNLRALHDSIFPIGGPYTPEQPLPVTFIIASNAVIGSKSTGIPAVQVGSWPANVILTVRHAGIIQGCGGAGGVGRDEKGGYAPPTAGKAGGTALYTREDIDLVLNGGRIWGGGGGGGGAATGNGNDIRGGGGGGGSGNLGAAGGSGPGNAESGKKGNSSTGGNGGRSWTKLGPWEYARYMDYRGGTGGGRGAPGAQGVGQFEHPTGANGGAAGRAIDGNSFVLQTGTGEVLGPTVN